MIQGARFFGSRAACLTMLAAALAAPREACAIAPVQLAGALEGHVSDDAGKPQMGASVQVFNREDKLIERTSTDEQGFFVFGGLTPDTYSVRVTLATFLPAFRSHIQVEAGASSLLEVSLSGLFSSIKLLPHVGRNAGLSNDDWKWVLRSASSTRPIFRYLPSHPDDPDAEIERHPTVFTDNRAVVRFSAGDRNGPGSPGEMGTAFAFATNLYGENSVAFLGDVAYAGESDLPSATIRAMYSREFAGMAPEISVTARQLYLPRWNSEGVPESDAGHPPIRSIASNIAEKTKLADSLELAYGAGFDSVTFIGHESYFSPYARLAWRTPAGQFEVTFTSGNARPELGAQTEDPNAELQHDLVALNYIPSMSVVDGRSRIEQGQDVELAWSHEFGSREVRVSGYRESVRNAAVMLSGSPGDAFSGNLIPDLYTDGLLFDVGNYHTTGYTAELTQHIGEDAQITVSYGSVGVLTTLGQFQGTTPDELRTMIRASERQAVTALASATIPHTGTHLVAGYQFLNDHSAMVARDYSTDLTQPQAGLNLVVRQPIPSFRGMPCRMDFDAEVRNMLAAGYLPISLADGRRLILVHNPRVVRGGVDFHF